ncbi:MAG: META domain-containing protein [Saprospiraceae bacterium]|nr:META domain-containing protein [Saprospiraceae bacterium]
MKFFWTVLCVCLLVACQNSEGKEGANGATVVKKGAGTSSGEARELLPVTEIDGNYELASAEWDGKEVKLRSEKKTTFSLKRGKLNGKSLCNGFTAGFALGENNTLSISEFSKGNRICSGKMGKEANLLSIIEHAGSYELLGSTALKVNSEKGNLVLRKLL